MGDMTRENRSILMALLQCYQQTFDVGMSHVPPSRIIKLQRDLRSTTYRSHIIPSSHRTAGISACLNVCQKALRLSSWASVLSNLQGSKGLSLAVLVESVALTQTRLRDSLPCGAFQGLQRELDNHHHAIKSIQLERVSEVFIKPLRIYLVSCRALLEEWHQYIEGETDCLYPHWIRLVWRAMLMLANIGTEDEWDDVIQAYQQFVAEYEQVIRGKEIRLRSGADTSPRSEIRG
ncbi:hypothetical protein LX36DRAFT_409674 [Colletotrichum falcatum]|nr:hypothetical protein LX36DRAFT_409674 [Colletotrichum falcatum]